MIVVANKIDSVKGLNISIVTTAKTDNEGRALLAYLEKRATLL